MPLHDPCICNTWACMYAALILILRDGTVKVSAASGADGSGSTPASLRSDHSC